MKNNSRYIARILIEAATPLAIGSGEKGLTTDRLVARDMNGLPYIPGTSLAGVTRHELIAAGVDDQVVNSLFGYDESSGRQGQGSRIIFSPGLMIAENGSDVIEGLSVLPDNSPYYSRFMKLPERDHVKISGYGAAVKHGKYDEEVVFKGTRFCFEMELEGNPQDADAWAMILEILHRPYTRLGAGSRKGFGKFTIISCKEQHFDLTKHGEIMAYLNKSASLNSDVSNWRNTELSNKSETGSWIRYKIGLQPESFFLFGSGTEGMDTDTGPKTESYISWKNEKPEFRDEIFLVPASSLKGALAHRVAFHYNQLTKNYIEDSGTISIGSEITPGKEKILEKFSSSMNTGHKESDPRSQDWDKWEEELQNLDLGEWLENDTGWNTFTNELEKLKKTQKQGGHPNNAVDALFGHLGEDNQTGSRGNVIISDIYLENYGEETKIFDHLSIDRFTGGGINGALYNEKVLYTEKYTVDILVNEKAFSDENIRKAFENTLDDLVNGLLQLGGNVNRGHGSFRGKYEIIK
ncbi:MAG: RAMP superfamily CRISPR-associated protein [Bacteroidales bacterium]|nr:RAMP superfamily CRISPR-associated protein [Bacteroidales bacterium]